MGHETICQSVGRLVAASEIPSASAPLDSHIRGEFTAAQPAPDAIRPVMKPRAIAGCQPAQDLKSAPNLMNFDECRLNNRYLLI